MYCVGIRAADDLARELEARAARERLDAQEHFAELPRAAGLLLVAAVTVRALGDRLAVRDLRRPRRDLEPEVALHPLDDETHVQLAEPPQHGLVHLVVELDLQARIFDRELVQRVGELFFLPALFQIDRDAMHRGRQVGGAQPELVFVMARVQHVAEMQILDLRDRAEVARDRRRHLAQLLTLHRVEMRDLHGFAPVADEHLIAGVDLALVHAQRGEPADVRIHVELEHVADEMARAVVAVDRMRMAVASREELGRVALERVRHELGHHAQQLPKARAGLCRHEADRNQVARAQRTARTARADPLRPTPHRARGSDP